MDKYIKNIIEEKFKKAEDKDLIDKEEKEEDVDEIVDKKGNIGRDDYPTDGNAKGITQKKTTDDVVKTGGGAMGIHGVHGTHTSLRYWAESELKGALGYDKTLADDADYDEALKYFKNELGLDDVEAEERMSQLGYDKKLAKGDSDKVRLVENPKQFIEAYIDEVILKKKDVEELVTNGEKKINPIILKQLTALKKSMKNNDLTINDVVKILKDEGNEKNINELFDSENIYSYTKIGEKDDDENTKYLKYGFITKDNTEYIVTIRIDAATNNGKIDFEAKKRFDYYKQENTNDNDSIKVLNTIIKITQSISDDLDTIYVSTSDDKRLKLYGQIARKMGYRIYKMNKSLVIYLK
jgi:hypothetical protein